MVISTFELSSYKKLDWITITVMKRILLSRCMPSVLNLKEQVRIHLVTMSVSIGMSNLNSIAFYSFVPTNVF